MLSSSHTRRWLTLLSLAAVAALSACSSGSRSLEIAPEGFEIGARLDGADSIALTLREIEADSAEEVGSIDAPVGTSPELHKAGDVFLTTFSFNTIGSGAIAVSNDGKIAWQFTDPTVGFARLVSVTAETAVLAIFEVEPGYNGPYTGNTLMIGLDPATGATNWEHRLGEISGPVLLDESIVVIESETAKAFAPATGEELWTTPVGEYEVATSGEGTAVLTKGHGTNDYQLLSGDGALTGPFRNDDPRLFRGVIEGHVLMGFEALAALDVDDGSETWAKTGFLLGDERDPPASPLIIKRGRVVRVVDPATGDVLVRVKADGQVQSGLTAESMVYSTSKDVVDREAKYELTAIDTSSGEVAWSTVISGYNPDSIRNVEVAAASGRTVYLLSTRAVLAHSAITGEFLWGVPAQEPTRVLAIDGSVFVFDRTQS